MEGFCLRLILRYFFFFAGLLRFSGFGTNGLPIGHFLSSRCRRGRNRGHCRQPLRDKVNTVHFRVEARLVRQGRHTRFRRREFRFGVGQTRLQIKDRFCHFVVLPQEAANIPPPEIKPFHEVSPLEKWACGQARPADCVSGQAGTRRHPHRARSVCRRSQVYDTSEIPIMRECLRPVSSVQSWSRWSAV
jgi:hypothetical protein